MAESIPLDPPLDSSHVSVMSWSALRYVLAVFPMYHEGGRIGALSYALELQNGQIGCLRFTRDGDGWAQEEPYMETCDTRSEAVLRAARLGGNYMHDIRRALEGFEREVAER
jgi:hypothetical protein